MLELGADVLGIVDRIFGYPHFTVDAIEYCCVAEGQLPRCSTDAFRPVSAIRTLPLNVRFAVKAELLGCPVTSCCQTHCCLSSSECQI